MKLSVFLQLTYFTFNDFSLIYQIHWINKMKKSENKIKAYSNRRNRHPMTNITYRITRDKKILGDKNLLKVDFVNHVAPLRFPGGWILNEPLDPLLNVSFALGKCCKRCSKCPTASFSTLFSPQTYASYLKHPPKFWRKSFMIYVCIYIHRERENEREKEIHIHIMHNDYVLDGHQRWNMFRKKNQDIWRGRENNRQHTDIHIIEDD